MERAFVSRRGLVLNAYKADVKITLGTDEGTPFNEFDRTAYQMVLLHKMRPEACTCTQAGTITTAELCCAEKTPGFLEQGKTAFFTVCRNNPPDDINNVMDCMMTVVKDKMFHTGY